jgi:hypothetical protein
MKLSEKELTEDQIEGVEQASEPAPPPVEPEPEPDNPIAARVAGKVTEDDAIIAKLKRDRGVRTSSEQLFSFLASIPRKHKAWDLMLTYVYRLKPVINRKQVNPDNQKNIGSFSELITEESLTELFGWGKYRIDVCWLGKKDDTRVMWTVWSPDCTMAENPPKLDLAELDLSNSDNRSYIEFLKSQGLIDNGGNIVESSNGKGATGIDPSLLGFIERQQQLLMQAVRTGQPKPNDVEGQAMSKAIEIVAQGSARANDLMMQQSKQQDPANTIELVKTVLAMAKPSGDGGNNDLIKLLMQQNTTLMQAMLTRPQREERDPLDQMLKMQEVMNTMRENNDGGSRGGGSWKDKLMDVAPVVFQTIGGIIQAAMAQKANGGMEAPPVHVTPTVVGSPTAIQAGGGSDSPTMDAQAQQRAAMAQQLAAYGPMLVRAVNRGEDGSKFAESIETMFGVESGVYPSIRAMGKEGIISALAMEPNTWQALQPMLPQLEQFVDEFLAYGNREDNNEG